jgi:integral membrane protein
MSRILFAVYRITAWVTGITLLALVFWAMPQKYIWDNPLPVQWVGVRHGYLFAFYVLVVLLVAFSRRWSLVKTALVVLAGTIPFASFYAEWKVARLERQKERPRDPVDEATR